ncbi:MAG: hypothetical protein ACK41E_09775 [Deinococcales bacterium]
MAECFNCILAIKIALIKEGKVLPSLIFMLRSRNSNRNLEPNTPTQNKAIPALIHRVKSYYAKA